METRIQCPLTAALIELKSHNEELYERLSPLEILVGLFDKDTSGCSPRHDFSTASHHIVTITAQSVGIIEKGEKLSNGPMPRRSIL
jgi:hypothetical protein